MLVFLCMLLVLRMVEMKSLEPETPHTVEKRASVCFDNLGCFSSDAPFQSPERPLSLPPDSPDKIQTKYQFYSRESQTTATELDARHPETVSSVWTNYKKRPTQFIVHGFINNPDSNDWLRNMKDELLKHGDYNVIIVNWSGGNLPPYGQASANTRIVGAQIALLIKELIKSKGSAAFDFHLIGHSLGAHAAGYAGERVPGLGRITGLDPAGPYFQNTDKTVRLDESDAVFVDVIHSDAENLLKLGFGTKQQTGHSDFYPNQGHDQPGCTRSPIAQISEYGFIQGLKEVVACNHLRSIKFFTESINTQCPFVAVPCASEDDFANQKCHTCTSAGCAAMGFLANRHIPPNGSKVKYFLTTAAHAPFCEYHVDLTVKFSSGKFSDERGTIDVEIHGSKGSSGMIPVNSSGDPMIIQPGKTYSYFMGAPSDVGTVQSVTFTWDHDSALLDPSTWNLLGLSHPTLFVDEVTVKIEETNAQAHFCVGAKGVETNKVLEINTKC